MCAPRCPAQVGMHHAREIMGPETVLVAAQQLLDGNSAEVRTAHVHGS